MKDDPVTVQRSRFVTQARRRAELIEQALELQWLALAWMLVEGVAGIGSGVAAHSLTLVAFGADGVIELLLAWLLVWRLSSELGNREAFPGATVKAARVGALFFAALVFCVVADSAWRLWYGIGQQPSVVALLLVTLAILLMVLFGRAKGRVAEAINIAALHADANQSMNCFGLSVVVCFGLLLQFILGAWWIDALSALATTPILMNKAREVWGGYDTWC